MESGKPSSKLKDPDSANQESMSDEVVSHSVGNVKELNNPDAAETRNPSNEILDLEIVPDVVMDTIDIMDVDEVDKKEEKEAIEMGGMLLALSKSETTAKTKAVNADGSRDKPITLLIVDTPAKLPPLAKTSMESPIDVDKPVIAQLDIVYKYSRTIEFVKLQDGENRYARSAVADQFLKDALNNGFGTFEVRRCKNWYQDLKMATVIDNPIDGKWMWQYSIVIINPSCNFPSKIYNPRIQKFRNMALAFYIKGFAPNDYTSGCIGLALDKQITIMMICSRKKVTDTAPIPPIWELSGKKIMVFAAVTFSTCIDTSSKSASSFITWCLVEDDKKCHPEQIDHWRRQGLGLFLIISVIKFCHARYIDLNYFPLPIVLFLQCYEPAALNFYLNIGFKIMNVDSDDGFLLLPGVLQDHLRQAQTVTGDSKSLKGKLFHSLKDGSSLSTKTEYKLMQLDHERLQHVRESPVRAMNLEIWCQYPPGTMNGVRYDFRIEVMRKVMEKLPLIQQLLPPPYQTVIPRTTSFVRGEMLLFNRSEHTKKAGEGWMATSEIDLMISILMFDGRYQNSCFVMPCGFCDTLAICFDYFKKYQEACEIALPFRQKNKISGTKDNSYFDIILTQCGKSFQDIQGDYTNSRKWFLQNVVIPNPGILNCKAIVFPCHEVNHWSATFVFNAGFHQNVQQYGESESNVQQACFFRYCSMVPNGSRTVEHAQGICWFLNLCHSYNVHASQNLTIDQKMSWLEPFGDAIKGNMIGTHLFPALRVPVNSHQLPSQQDRWNCGIGIAATIGIILRDVVSDGPHVSFDSRFMKNTLKFLECPLPKEIYCEFPGAVIQEEPKTPSNDYLWHLREEFFVVFDRIAELEHDTMPNKLLDDYTIPKFYTDALPLIKTWPGMLDRKKPAGKKLPRAKPKDDLMLPPPERNLATDMLKEALAVKPDSASKEDETKKKDDNNQDESKQHDDNEKKDDSKKDESKQDDDTKKKDDSKNDESKQDKKTLAKKLKLPLKRKLDAVEEHAERLLTMIKARNPKDAQKLMKDKNGNKYEGLPDPTQKFCTQTKVLFDSLHKEYGSTGFPTPPIRETGSFEADKEKFIADSFKAWGWNSQEAHEKEIIKLRNKKLVKDLKESTVRDIDKMIQSLQNERKKYRKFFWNEFLCSQPSLVQSVKFIKSTNTFQAKLVWKELIEETKTPSKKRKKQAAVEKQQFIEHEDIIDVEEEWVKSEFAPMFDLIVNMRQDQDNWTQTPRDVPVFIGNKKIIKLRYIPPSERSIVDMRVLSERIENDLNKVFKDSSQPINDRIDRRRSGSKYSTPNKVSGNDKDVQDKASAVKSPRDKLRSSPQKGKPLRLFEVPDERTELKAKMLKEAKERDDVPHKIIIVPEKWLGKYVNGNTTVLEEEYVRKTFGDNFTDELKQLKRGFVDIPIGDYKPSRLHQNLHLKVIGAPAIRYMQSDGNDRCVSKSLASALFALGWHDKAQLIDTFGDLILNGAVVDSMKRVKEEARRVLPPWIVISPINKAFDWKTDLRENELVLGVLFASDNSCSHAVSIHGKFIYDANEPVALPLTDEALDYCTSTETVKTTFICFKFGFRFFYEGQRAGRLMKMKLAM